MLRIGFQSHIVLKCKTKLYCKCVPDKTHCSVCHGQPGALPSKVSHQALRKALSLGVALNATPSLFFEPYRKHYRYYDLPNGYQRTQHPSNPLFSQGRLELLSANTTLVCKGYLEEDPASLKKNSVDFRRCGSPLLELVTECKEVEAEKVGSLVKEYFRTLKRLVLDLKIASSRKTLKTDVNVSIEGSPRYQIKNLSSLRDMLEAVNRAVGHLKTDHSGTAKTYHFKNDLIYSRDKKDYLFSKEWNHPLIRILKVPKKRLSLYLGYLQKQKSSPHKLNYVFLKKLFKLLESRKITETQLEEFSKLDPLIGLKQLQLKLKSSQRLRFEVLEYTRNKFSQKDFNEKNSDFLAVVKALKVHLNNNKVPFSSYSINTILRDSFSTPE